MLPRGAFPCLCALQMGVKFTLHPLSCQVLYHCSGLRCSKGVHSHNARARAIENECCAWYGICVQHAVMLLGLHCCEIMASNCVWCMQHVSLQICSMHASDTEATCVTARLLMIVQHLPDKGNHTVAHFTPKRRHIPFAMHTYFADLSQIRSEPYSFAIAGVRPHYVKRHALCLACVRDTLRTATSLHCLGLCKRWCFPVLAAAMHANQSFDCFCV